MFHFYSITAKLTQFHITQDFLFATFRSSSLTNIFVRLETRFPCKRENPTGLRKRIMYVDVAMPAAPQFLLVIKGSLCRRNKAREVPFSSITEMKGCCQHKVNHHRGGNG